MRLNDLEEFRFDDVPKLYDPRNKVFITHLLHLEDMIPPKKFPKMITTFKLARKMQQFFARKQITCDNFIILKAYKPYEIKMSNGMEIQVLLCDSDDYSNNIMVLIKKDHELTYLYANMFTQTRKALLNSNFTKWVSKGVKYLYLNLKRAEERCELDDMERDIKHIVVTLISNKNSRIHINVPVFGYENFIAALMKRLPNSVYLSDEHRSVMHDHLEHLKINYDSNEAQVCIVTKFLIYDPSIIKMSFTKVNFKNVLKLTWSPLPKSLNLRLLTRLVHPTHIYGIINIYNMERQVPKYLYELSKSYKNRQKTPKKDEHQTTTAVDALEAFLNTDAQTQTTTTEDGLKGQNFVRVVHNLNYVDENSEKSDD